MLAIFYKGQGSRMCSGHCIPVFNGQSRKPVFSKPLFGHNSLLPLMHIYEGTASTSLYLVKVLEWGILNFLHLDVQEWRITLYLLWWDSTKKINSLSLKCLVPGITNCYDNLTRVPAHKALGFHSITQKVQGCNGYGAQKPEPIITSILS